MKTPPPDPEAVAAARLVETAQVAAEKIVDRAAAAATELVLKTATKLGADERLRVLEAEKQMRDALLAERVLASETYAKILVEKIVFGVVALIAVGFVGALLALVFR